MTKTIGYKAMNQDMTCHGFQFEIGKTYTVDNEKPLEVCSDSGFHFCLNLEDVFKYYDYDNCRLFEVETESEVLTKGNKSITKTITIKRELTPEELSKHKFKLQHLNIYFSNISDEELVSFKNDKFWRVRLAVVNKMTDLDLMYNTFKDDKAWRVREAVINKMTDLYLMYNTFKNDKDYDIRFAVIKKMNKNKDKNF